MFGDGIRDPVANLVVCLPGIDHCNGESDYYFIAFFSKDVLRDFVIRNY